MVCAYLQMAKLTAIHAMTFTEAPSDVKRNSLNFGCPVISRALFRANWSDTIKNRHIELKPVNVFVSEISQAHL